MRRYAQVSIQPGPIGITPSRLGVNVEIIDHADRVNLWDWLADSNASAVRVFHPEVSLRDASDAADRWADVSSRAEFDTWRNGMSADPDRSVPWERYRFNRTIPWLGVGDEIARRVSELGLEPLYSLGYGPALHPRPLVEPVDHIGPVEDEQITWSAAASAYEYYLAVIYRYAARFGGRIFMMINEPENRRGEFHLPADLAELGGDLWRRCFWDDDDPDSPGARYVGVIATQYGVLARLARWALEDVRRLLADREQASALRLTGPTTVLWKPLWQTAGEYLDACDVHHYHSDPGTFGQVIAAAEWEAGRTGKAVALSEFGRRSGGINIDQMLFSLDRSLEVAELLMTVLSAQRPGGPAMDFATFYLLHFPSTHRNYKHLLYGDMNLLDWTGRDRPLWGRQGWYPSAEEMQIRFATPAYYLFRQLARCDGGGEVLAAGVCNPTSSGPEDAPHRLRVLAVSNDETVIVNLLNLDDEGLTGELDVSRLSTPARWAVLRETSRMRCDEPVSMHALRDGRAPLTLPARSLTQVILTPLELEHIDALRLVERTATPGSLAGLERWETTRLRALAEMDGRQVDVSELHVVWESSRPDVIRTGASGLIQRLRDDELGATVTARTLGGAAEASAELGGG